MYNINFNNKINYNWKTISNLFINKLKIQQFTHLPNFHCPLILVRYNSASFSV